MKNRAMNQPVNPGPVKVPVIIQLEALECGAACLAMILAYYGKWVPLEQVRADCDVSRDGSSAKNILLAAKNYGLQAKGYRVEPEVLKEQGTFPCIVHWNFEHFVVCTGFKNQKVYINDPDKGEYTVTLEQFDESFTGVVLLFEPTEAFEPGGQKKSILSFVKKRLTGARSAIAFTVITMIIASLIGIITPGFSRVFLDHLLTGKNPEWLYPFVIGLFLLSLLQIIVAWIEAIYSLRINGKLAIVGNTAYMWHILRLPMQFFSQRMAGDLINRQEDHAGIAKTLVDTLAPLLMNTVLMVFYFVVMLRYSVRLTIIGLSSIVINVFFASLISKKRIGIMRILLKYTGKLSSTTVAGIEMIESIKSSGAEDGYFERWAGYQASENTQNVRYMKNDQYLGLLPNLVSAFTDSIVLLTGVWLTMQGQFSIGRIMAFQGLMSSFVGPASSLTSAGQAIQEMRTQMERIEDVMEYPMDFPYLDEEGRECETTSYEKLSGKIEMRHVTFGYSKLKDPLIQDLNLSVDTGKSLAIVGASGCGKSTITKLLSGLYQPWEGEILFDGKPITGIDRNVFTGSLAIVDQEIILYEDTIANNIKLWDNTIEDFEMILAARDAKIHEEIMHRDGGYQYRLMEGGKDFSGGQRQRIEIARVLAQDPTIIVLDEATSALDAKTEFEVVNAIRSRGITCIVVAHRLSTIRDCDEIIVLDHGTVVERGSHEELYHQNGVYTQLVSNE